jgi:hypothetical protein
VAEFRIDEVFEVLQMEEKRARVRSRTTQQDERNLKIFSTFSQQKEKARCEDDCRAF